MAELGSPVPVLANRHTTHLDRAKISAKIPSVFATRSPPALRSAADSAPLIVTKIVCQRCLFPEDLIDSHNGCMPTQCGSTAKARGLHNKREGASTMRARGFLLLCCGVLVRELLWPNSPPLISRGRSLDMWSLPDGRYRRTRALFSDPMPRVPAYTYIIIMSKQNPREPVLFCIEYRRVELEVLVEPIGRTTSSSFSISTGSSHLWPCTSNQPHVSRPP